VGSVCESGGKREGFAPAVDAGRSTLHRAPSCSDAGWHAAQASLLALGIARAPHPACTGHGGKGMWSRCMNTVLKVLSNRAFGQPTLTCPQSRAALHGKSMAHSSVCFTRIPP
jgi:hypothetical protein